MTLSRLTQVAGAALATTLLTGAVAAPVSHAGGPNVKPTQERAALLTSHKALAKLRGTRSYIATVRAHRPITGGQTVLPVIGRATTSGGEHWLRVLLPGRPNGGKGWIRERGTVSTTTPWHLVISTSRRRVRVYRRGRLIRNFAAVVGKLSTPTPHGRFFVEESVSMPSGTAGGPYALALSARSNVLQEFDGGPGQIALHGVANLGGTPGTAISHGCVRLSNRHITWMAARISAGIRVTINQRG